MPYPRLQCRFQHYLDGIAVGEEGYRGRGGCRVGKDVDLESCIEEAGARGKQTRSQDNPGARLRLGEEHNTQGARPGEQRYLQG